MKTEQEPTTTGGSDEAHRLFEPEDEPNIISRSTPTTTGGQWTPQTVFDLLGSDYGSDGWKRERQVADAHNAAVKEAYEITFAAQQAALREGIKSGELEQQLADEQEKRNGFRRALEQRISEVDQLRAAVNALKEIERDSDGWEQSIASGALAKIGAKT